MPHGNHHASSEWLADGPTSAGDPMSPLELLHAIGSHVAALAFGTLWLLSGLMWLLGAVVWLAGKDPQRD
jgi:hypothetical protein